MVAGARHTARHFRRLASCPSVKAFREWGILLDQPSVSERPWLSFDYIEGTRLADHILSGRVKHPLRILLAVCDALAPIHRLGFAIGDFDCDRNLLLERGSGLIKFCDLDAGGPTEPPPGLDDDMHELIRLSRRMWSRSDPMAKAVVAALESSQNAIQAGRALRSNMATTPLLWRQAPRRSS